MLKKTCPNGHVYDQNIYGDICPLCSPTPSTRSDAEPDINGVAPGVTPGAHTKVVTRPLSPDGDMKEANAQPQFDPTGPTKLSPRFAFNAVANHAWKDGHPAQSRYWRR